MFLYKTNILNGLLYIWVRWRVWLLDYLNFIAFETSFMQGGSKRMSRSGLQDVLPSSSAECRTVRGGRDFRSHLSGISMPAATSDGPIETECSRFCSQDDKHCEYHVSKRLVCVLAAYFWEGEFIAVYAKFIILAWLSKARFINNASRGSFWQVNASVVVPSSSRIPLVGTDIETNC